MADRDIDILVSGGGIAGLIAQTPAGQNRRIVDMSDAQILSFGPRTAAVPRRRRQHGHRPRTWQQGRAKWGVGT